MARGKKTCPSCSTETGPRTYKCKNCGFDFAAAKAKAAKEVSTEKREKKTSKEEEYIHPEVAKLMADPPVETETEHLTPDEHADRILSYGRERAGNLLGLAKSSGGWKHVNWKRVEERL
jgi:hypothetical protein